MCYFCHFVFLVRALLTIILTTVVDIDILHWAENINVDSDNIVKSLAGLPPEAKVTDRHLGIAVRTVRARFIVGLMNQMEESIHRFNIFMGVDETEKVNRECMDEYFGHGVKKSNSNSHPKVSKWAIRC